MAPATYCTQKALLQSMTVFFTSSACNPAVNQMKNINKKWPETLIFTEKTAILKLNPIRTCVRFSLKDNHFPVSKVLAMLRFGFRYHVKSLWKIRLPFQLQMPACLECASYSIV